MKEEITLTAIDYGLLTRYTSFLAVDYRIRNPGGDSDTVEQPNEGPAGVDLSASIGTDVSRIYTPPGDPLLTVDAPEAADSVIAFFPWGEVAEMRWDESRHQWFHRFLVPRGVDDGEIFIRVVEQLIKHNLMIFLRFSYQLRTAIEQLQILPNIDFVHIISISF